MGSSDSYICIITKHQQAWYYSYDLNKSPGTYL